MTDLHLTDTGPGSFAEIVAYVREVLGQRTTPNDDTSAEKLARGIVTSILHRLGAGPVGVAPATPVYGPPPGPERGEPVTYLAGAIEVQRPNGDVVRMDLVALADAAIRAERAVEGLTGELAALRLRVAALEVQAKRTAQAGRLLAGDLTPCEDW